jgi:hypothetical protein
MTGHQSSTFSQIRESLVRSRKTLFRLVFYVTVVGVGSIFAIDLLSIAWMRRPWGIVRHITRGMFALLSLDAATFYYLPTGVFAGLMGVLLLDSYKRTQGIILWLGIAVGSVVVLLGQNLLIQPLIDGFSPVAAALGVLGAGGGLLLGGVRPSRFDSTGGELEFPEAPNRLFRLSLLIVGYGVLEAVVSYSSPIVGGVGGGGGIAFQPFAPQGINVTSRILLDVAMSGLGLVGLYKFTSYESHTKMILIGPQRSGKSASFGGLQLAVRDLIDEQAGIKSNTHVAGLSDNIANGEFPDATVRQKPLPLEINYRTGGVFPEKRTIHSVDYAGELLPEILDPVIGSSARTDGGRVAEQGASGGDDGPSLAEVVGEEEEEEADDEGARSYVRAESWEEATARIHETDRSNAGRAIWDCIRHADRVIMTIPLDDFITPIVDRGNWPPYQPVETFDGDMTPEEIREEHDVPTEATLHRYADGYYYLVDEPERASPSEYLSWYRDLVREFHDEKEFLLVGTLADWAIEDFERENPRGLNPLISDNYPEFCQYVYEQVLLQENANVQDLFAATQDDQIHLLWYPIANTEPPTGDEEFRIDTSTVSPGQNNHQTLLNGAKQFLDRLNR